MGTVHGCDGYGTWVRWYGTWVRYMGTVVRYMGTVVRYMGTVVRYIISNLSTIHITDHTCQSVPTTVLNRTLNPKFKANPKP